MSNRPHRRRAAHRPNRSQVDAVVRTSAAMLGCTCTEVDIRVRPGHTAVDVAHDAGCPAEHAGTVPILLAGWHR